jgi:hypothetical protein
MRMLRKPHPLSSCRGICMAMSNSASCVLSLLNVPRRTQAVKHTSGHPPCPCSAANLSRLPRLSLASSTWPCYEAIDTAP